MSDAKVNYYEVMQNTIMHELDEDNGFAFPIKNEQGKKWIVNKGQYVKSFGQTRTLKNADKVKETYLILVNGGGVILKDVTLFKDEVDDCGCDMMPIAKPTDLEKLEEYNKSMPPEDDVNDEKKEIKSFDKESAYINKKGKFDKNGIIGFILGGAIVGGLIWLKTKDKKKAIIGLVAGAVIGMVIGYLIGRRGTKKIADVNKIDELEKTSKDSSINKTSGDESQIADKQEFLQLGKEYDFNIPLPVYALNYIDDAFYLARNEKNEKIKIDANSSVRGKLVEVKEPQIFLLDNKSKKLSKVKNKKPLPFVKIGNELYIPLALTNKNSFASKQDGIKYVKGESLLDDEIYIKGRYAGKKYFYLVYMPELEDLVTKIYQK